MILFNTRTESEIVRNMMESASHRGRPVEGRYAASMLRAGPMLIDGATLLFLPPGTVRGILVMPN
jgi:hypothetical protein